MGPLLKGFCLWVTFQCEWGDLMIPYKCSAMSYFLALVMLCLLHSKNQSKFWGEHRLHNMISGLKEFYKWMERQLYGTFYDPKNGPSSLNYLREKNSNLLPLPNVVQFDFKQCHLTYRNCQTVMVSFMCLLGVSRYLVKHYFGVCLWGCFQMRLSFASVD